MMKHSFFYELQIMRENFKADTNKKIKLPKIDWLMADLLGEIYESAETLLEKGEVYYAAVIQANTLLFKRFPCWDCPMEIIYSTEDFLNENPYFIQNTAHYIYSFKNRDDDEVPSPIKTIGVSDEYQRDFKTPIVMSELIEPSSDEFIEQLRKSVLYCSSVMVFRKYIPKKTIKGNIVPIIVSPYCRSIMVLPKKYWTEGFIKNYWA